VTHFKTAAPGGSIREWCDAAKAIDAVIIEPSLSTAAIMPGFDNIIWDCLSGSQRALSLGNDRIRRYAPGFPLIMAFCDLARPPLHEIAAHCPAGEHLYCCGWNGPMPAGWHLEVDAAVAVMSWQGGVPAADSRVVRLGAEHVPAMMELFAIAKPGPFAMRAMEIGEWYGVFEEGRLVALAGERMHAGEWREVSGVCTLPDRQGRGYARRVTERVIASQAARGLKTFLHVFPGNTRAIELYKRMGFVTEREMPLRVISRVAEHPGRAPMSMSEQGA
jgi:GNAT superfamily N-acetyltransferase